MSANDKVYLRATALQVAGCTGEAFKAWRNRLGLFPETQKAEGWNRYSFTDIVTLALVNELTRRGIVAQVAVAAAMVARPLLADLFEIKLPKEFAGQTDALASAVLGRMMNQSAIEMGIYLPYMAAEPNSEFTPPLTCRFWSATSPVNFSDQRMVVVIYLYEMVGFLFSLMHMFGTETELSDGTRRIEPGKVKAFLPQKLASPKKIAAPRKRVGTPKRAKR